MFAVMFEFANRVAERSPPLKSTSMASALAMFITLSVMAFTSSLEYMSLIVRGGKERQTLNLRRPLGVRRRLYAAGRDFAAGLSAV
jgi:hypothetical protein